MKRTIVIRDEAEAELVSAAVWYSERRRGLGDEMLDEVAAALMAIAEGFDGVPYLSLADGVRTRRLLLSRFPYAVVFVPERRI